MDDAHMLTSSFLPFLPLAKVYIDKKLKRNSGRAPDDLIGDILHQSRLSKKELYAAITELQIGGVETVSILHFWRNFKYRGTKLVSLASGECLSPPTGLKSNCTQLCVRQKGAALNGDACTVHMDRYWLKMLLRINNIR